MSDSIIHSFPLKLQDGTTIAATVERRPRDSTCWLHLSAQGISETATSTDYFRSFSEIRSRLAERGIFPLCYAASRNIWPSGMARDMGQGLKAYKLQPRIRGGELHDIFSTGSDIEPCTPEEQEAFARNWFKSFQ